MSKKPKGNKTGGRGVPPGGGAAGGPRARRAKYYVFALCAFALLAVTVWATRYDAVRRAVGMRPLLAPAAQQQTPLPLAKEYVYAGGRLVATEEPHGLRFVVTAGASCSLSVSGYLTWADYFADETGFVVERRNKVNGVWEPWYQVETLGPNITQSSSILVKMIRSEFVVKAVKPSGPQVPYNTVSVLGMTGCQGAGAPVDLVATALTANSVSLQWAAPAGTVDHYEVERRGGQSAEFTPLATSTGAAFTDNSVSPDTAYLYRVKAVLAGGGSSDYGNTDLATTVVFTDAELPGTPIKAAHLAELRRAVNAVRALAGGLGSASWTYPAPVSSPPSQRRPVYLEDVTDLRARLDEALGPLGLQVPYPPTPTLARYEPVYGAHFEQIRARVK